MENIDIKIDGQKLIVTIDLAQGVGDLSASGKSRSVASTNGNVKVSYPALAGLTLGVNCYVPVK
jgi:hypothetical protein